MNQDIKRELIAVLRAEPRRVNMTVGIEDANSTRIETDTGGGPYKERFHPAYNIPPCGTIGCIAGHVVLLREFGYDTVMAGLFKPTDVKATSWWQIEEQAARLLQLRILTEATALFHLQHWPIHLQAEISAFAPGSPEYAECVIRAIEIFDAAGNRWPEEAE